MRKALAGLRLSRHASHQEEDHRIRDAEQVAHRNFQQADIEKRAGPDAEGRSHARDKRAYDRAGNAQNDGAHYTSPGKLYAATKRQPRTWRKATASSPIARGFAS